MKVLKSILVITFLCLSTVSAFSAPAPPVTTGPACWPPPCVPVDGGISFLIAAGALYGAKKLKDSRSAKSL